MSNRFSVTLPPDLSAYVDQEAKDKAVSKADVIRMRLKESYDREAQTPAPEPTTPQPQE